METFRAGGFVNEFVHHKIDLQLHPVSCWCFVKCSVHKSLFILRILECHPKTLMRTLMQGLLCHP